MRTFNSDTISTQPMALQGRRKEDLPTTRIWSRSERLFEEAGSWHFYTREGTVEGPFSSKFGALDRLDTYIRMMQAGISVDTDRGPGFELMPQ